MFLDRHDICFSRHLVSLSDCLILAFKYDSNYTLDDHNYRKSTDADEKDDLYGLLNVVYHQSEHY